MARVSLLRCWGEDDYLRFTVEPDSDYPDALAEAKRIVLDGFAEALGMTLAAEAKDDEP